MFRMAHYPPHLSTSKLANGPSYPWYPAASLNSATPLAALGAYWELQGDVEVGGGNAFIYVKNSSAGALTAGQAVSWALPVAAAIGTFTLTNSTLQVIYTNIDSSTLGNMVGAWLYCQSAATGGPWVRKILDHQTAASIGGTKVANGANTVFTISRKDPNSPAGAADIDQIAALPANAVPVSVIRHFEVVACTASTPPIGITLGAVSASNYTIVQVLGFGLAQITGHASLSAAGMVVYPGAAGVLTYAAAVPITMGAAIARVVHAYTTVATSLMPLNFNFSGNL